MLPTNPRRRLKLVALCVVVGLVSFGFWPASSASLLKQARTAESNGKFDRALDLASRAIERDPLSIEGILFAGSIANKLGNELQELKYYRLLPESANGPRIAKRLKEAGQLALKCGRASDAEFFYQRALALSPEDQVIHRRLGTLFRGEARRWESAPHL